MTLQEALESFIKYRESYCSQATINDYVSNLNIFIRYINNPDLQIDSVTIAQIVAYQTYLRDYVNPYNGKKLAVRSIRTYMTDVRTFFNYLYDFELIEKNPVKKVKIIKDTQRQLAPLTVDEISAVDRCFELSTLNGLRNYLMFHLFLDCGMRRQEVFNLCFRDVHFREGYIFVQGKGRKERFVALPLFIKDRFKIYLTMLGEPLSSLEHCFKLVDGREFTDNALKDVYARLQRRTHIKRLHPHFCRHTFATSYIFYGGDVINLREILGHYDVEITQNYVHEASKLRLIHYPIYKIDECFIGGFTNE